jgi:tubulin-folding cofactor B
MIIFYAYSKINADSVRRFKQINKLGRFADKPVGEENDYKKEAEKIIVGDRCEVQSEEGWNRRGQVKFVGETSFKPGYWVGVEYDEPVGKHDGTVDGTKYFDSRPKHGAFLRPDKVVIGDFPEENFDDEFEEM